MQHLLVPSPCKSWLSVAHLKMPSVCASAPQTSLFPILEGETQGLVFPWQQFVWYPDVVHVQFSFEQSSYLTEQFLSFLQHKTCCVVYSGPRWLSTELCSVTLPWTGASYGNSVFVKTEDSLTNRYCLGLGSKMPRLANCKNIKHIELGHRIKRNESNERWKQHFFSSGRSCLQLGPLSTV